MNYNDFRKHVKDHYRRYARELPWRVPDPDGRFDPYKILVSEIMLQQTQVERVVSKYLTFLERFPTADALSKATLSDVLALWSGLGYNRRAKYLLEASRHLSGKPFPAEIEELMKLKGVGYNTAAAILTYAFNQPHPFVETNIRTVFIYHFFSSHSQVDDSDIKALLELTIDKKQPREFMWALMDYGTSLKSRGIRNTAQSKHYTKQSKFQGSLRQLRGEILRRVRSRPSLDDLRAEIKDPRLDLVLGQLKSEGFIRLRGNRLLIAA